MAARTAGGEVAIIMRPIYPPGILKPEEPKHAPAAWGDTYIPAAIALERGHMDLHGKKRELEEAIGRLILAFQTETGLRVAGLSVAGVDTRIRESDHPIPAVCVDARL
jgi:hypothetical protein